MVIKGKQIRCQKSCETFAGFCGISGYKFILILIADPFRITDTLHENKPDCA